MVVRSGDVDVGFGHCWPRVRVAGDAALKSQYCVDGCLLESITGQRDKESYDTRACTVRVQ